MPQPVQLSPEEQAQYNAATQPVQLSPEEQAQYDAAAKPKPINPFVDLSAPELADLNRQAPDQFNLIGEYGALPAQAKTPELTQKAAEAYDLIKQQPFSVPKPARMLSNLWQAAKGVGEWAMNYGKLAGVAGLKSAITGNPSWDVQPTSPDDLEKIQRGIAESWAGTESAVTGLGNQIANAFLEPETHPSQPYYMRGLGMVHPQPAPDSVYEQNKLSNFQNAVAQSQQAGNIATGHGEFMNAAGGEVIKELEKVGLPLRPDHVEQLASADPFSWWAFGKAFDALPVASKAAIPAEVGESIKSLGDAAAQKLKTGVGKPAEWAGKAGEVTAKGITKSAPIIGPIGAIVTGYEHSGIPGAIAALAIGGHGLGEAITKFGEMAGKAAKGLQDFGRGVAGPEATGPISQAVKDAIEAAPGAAGEVAKGAAIDLGLQAATAETPEQKEGFTPFGTALGLLHGSGGVGRWMLSGQLAGPRELAAVPGVPNSGAFPTLNSLHNQAMQAAPPKVQERIRAIQQFKHGVAPGTDIFYIPKSADDKLPSTLQNLGVTETRAFDIAGSDGVSTQIPDARGVPKNVIIFRDVAAAPHEVQHAMDLVLGENQVDQLNAAAKSDYSDLWDKFTNYYAELLNKAPLAPGQDAGKLILDKSGFGAEGVKKKLGADATPAQLNDWGHVLNPAEQQSQLDRYIGAEIRAENADAYFKAGGQSKSFLGKMANATASLTHLFGGEPLAGRTSEGLNVPLRFGTFSSAADAIARTKNAIPPSVRPIAKPPSPGSQIPQTPEEIAKNAEDARAIANAAPATAAPGVSPTTTAARQSPKEALGIVAEAIASQTPLEYNYSGAPGHVTTGGIVDAEMEKRRQEIESARNLPDDERNLSDVRNGFPYKIEMTGKGPQILDWSPASLTANAIRWAKALGELSRREPTAPELTTVPYPVDARGEFTAEGWKQLLADAQKFSANHLAGFTGTGEPLVVPAGLEAAGVHAPLRTTATAPEVLPQDKADFINMLYGERPPETARVSRKSNVPLNVVGQKVSEATQAGRIVEPAKVHAKKAQAAALGITPGTLIERAPFKQPIMGVERIQEMNPMRGALENALQRNGIELPGMTQVVRRLNLEHIHSVSAEPNLPRTVGRNSLTLAAGFLPRRNNPKAVNEAAIRDEKTGKIYTGSLHASALEDYYHSLGLDDTAAEKMANAWPPNPALTEGFVTNEGEFLDRDGAFKRAVELRQYEPKEQRRMRDFPEITQLEADSFNERRQFMPSKDPRAVSLAAVRDEDTGKIYTGAWHGEANYHYLRDIGQSEDDAALGAMNSRKNLTDGFVTNSGEFLGREDALKRAEELGQYQREARSETTLESSAFASQRKAARPFRWDSILKISFPRKWERPQYPDRSRR